MNSEKVTILGVGVIKNTPQYYFLAAAEKLSLNVKGTVKLPRIQDGFLRERTVMQITDGQKTLLTLGATTSQTSYLGMKIAVNKIATNGVLKKFGLPVTNQIDIHSEKDLSLALSRFGKIILKPANSRAGKGIFSNIQTIEKAFSIYKLLKKQYSIIVAEKILEGNEYRVLVVNGRVFAVAQYIPPMVIGDGKLPIGSLIKNENARRLSNGDDHLIKINPALHLNLRASRLSLKSILEAEQVVVLHKAAPISNGGHTIDVTNRIHPSNKSIAERAAQLINLDIAGVDIITPQIEDPIESSGGAIIEINGGPDLGVHFNVTEGEKRNGAEAVLKDYFHL
jgi:cyanophycin synthetase